MRTPMAPNNLHSTKIKKAFGEIRWAPLVRIIDWSQPPPLQTSPTFSMLGAL